MTNTASDPREAAETALMAAVYRQNLSYKYGTVADRQESEEWAAVRAAYRQGLIAELEVLPCPADHAHICGRVEELRRAP